MTYDQEPNKYNLWNKRQSILNTIEDEFNHFINASPTNLPAGITALNQQLNPSNQINYLALYRMVINILSIPPMLSKLERIFLGARRIIIWQRIKLGLVNIKRSECLKLWVRGELVQGWRKELLVNVREGGGGVETSMETLATSIQYYIMPRLVILPVSKISQLFIHIAIF